MLDRAVLPPHAVARWAAQTPDAVAVAHVDGRGLTYAQLHADALTWAGALRGLGVEAGSHVATLLPQGFYGHRTLLALGWLRAVEVPLNTAYVGDILRHALSLSDAEFLLTTEAFLERIRPLLGVLPRLGTIVLVDSVPDEAPAPLVGEEVTPARQPRLIGAADFAGAVAAADAHTFDGPHVWDIASLLFTSGTTGPSKAVITPWGLALQMWSWVPDDTIGPGEGLFNPLPMFHNSGRSGFAYALAHGARFVIRDKFSATSFWDDVRGTDCRTAALVGPMTALIYGAPPRADDADNPLRNVILGPMIPEMEAFEKRFGVRVATCYGQTEVGAPIASGWDHGPWEATGRERTSYPWPEIRLVDAHDEPVPDGEVGELVVRSAEPWALNLGYYRMPAESMEAWRNGWFHTGDMFRRDAEGWYTFFDRRKDVLRRRGENISSFEVERGVGEHPAVVECVAVGVPSGLGDDEVLAAVLVNDPAFEPASLVEFLDGRMPSFMIPRYVRVLDDFPRNSTTGRVRKDELRALVAEDRGWDRLGG
ncbi:AMP-binding protein [Cryptosporangium aurantiacum]|uniref:Crotonobetaine/carnitine-CoA ligase n=1 Tax=Cryptosporangium aurantiacum TaxID=134849 RepID=A0A1M7RJT3_9ACTN|nr:AMP-binding protein [Cryptosporangium aurantiacum]SHN46567.1 crotonobetaine/carnitine-CoA ligase [Cryptosporangium aurantiacum]